MPVPIELAEVLEECEPHRNESVVERAPAPVHRLSTVASIAA